jgi:processive 1,2-diacylglycerol beta-glucosyltransferase
VYRNNQLFFVAHQGMVEELMKLGVDRSKICVSGIPVSPKFLKKFDKNKLREKLNLSDKPVILFMVGGSDIELLMEIMDSLVKVKNDFQIVMITGRNRAVFKELKRQFLFSRLDGKVLSFVNNVNEYMSAADLMLSKAGGLTVTEALTVGLPMVIVRPIPGQEDGNTKFLTEAGAAVYTKEIKDMGLMIDDLLANPKKLEQMTKNAKKLALPNAAEVILEESMKLK